MAWSPAVTDGRICSYTGRQIQLNHGIIYFTLQSYQLSNRNMGLCVCISSLTYTSISVNNKCKKTAVLLRVTPTEYWVENLGYGIIQGHWKWRRSVDHIWLYIGLPLSAELYLVPFSRYLTFEISWPWNLGQGPLKIIENCILRKPG